MSETKELSDELIKILKEESHLHDLIEQVMINEHNLIDMLCAAYYRFTDINPNQAVLVRQVQDDKVKWWIERKEQ